MTASALTRPGQRERLSEKFGEIDWRIIGLLCVIAGVGTMMLFSIGGQSWSPWAANHLVRFLVMLVAAIGIALIDLQFFFRISYPVYGATLFLLFMVPIFGVEVNGAKLWLDLGITRLQPGEFMKVGVVMALARWYHGATAQEARWHWKLIFPAAIVGLPTLFVAAQPDLGTALLIALAGGSVMFAAGLDWKIIFGGLAATIASVPAVVMFVLKDYQRERVTTFLDPTSDTSDAGYQIIQALTAIGSGSVLGRGFGLGSQSQLDYLPEKQTDFILAAFAEEFGFVGCAALLVTFLAVILGSLRIATLSHNHFGRLIVTGIIATFAFYMLLNGAMVVGLAPVVGVPMPLVSYGGSVITTVMVGFGLILCVRVHRYQELPSGRGQLF
jgi:rod shape determining protein RodA